MLEELKSLVGVKLDNYDLWIDSVFLESEGKEKTLNIVLDSDKILDLATVTMASRILNPVIDKADFIKGEYVLDIYAKPRGDGNNE